MSANSDNGFYEVPFWKNRQKLLLAGTGIRNIDTRPRASGSRVRSANGAVRAALAHPANDVGATDPAAPAGPRPALQAQNKPIRQAPARNVGALLGGSRMKPLPPGPALFSSKTVRRPRASRTQAGATASSAKVQARLATNARRHRRVGCNSVRCQALGATGDTAEFASGSSPQSAVRARSNHGHIRALRANRRFHPRRRWGHVGQRFAAESRLAQTANSDLGRQVAKGSTSASNFSAWSRQARPWRAAIRFTTLYAP